MAGLDHSISQNGYGGEGNQRLRHIPRIGFYASPEFRQFFPARLRPNQHAVLPGLIGRFNHQLVQVFQNVLTLQLVDAKIAWHVR